MSGKQEWGADLGSVLDGGGPSQQAERILGRTVCDIDGATLTIVPIAFALSNAFVFRTCASDQIRASVRASADGNRYFGQAAREGCLRVQNVQDSEVAASESHRKDGDAQVRGKGALVDWPTADGVREDDVQINRRQTTHLPCTTHVTRDGRTRE